MDLDLATLLGCLGAFTIALTIGLWIALHWIGRP